MNKKELVKKGSFSYGSLRIGNIKIFKTDWRPGTGDWQDSDEWREDQFGTYFVVEFELKTETMKSNAGGGHHDTLDEAIASVEAKCKEVEWA